MTDFDDIVEQVLSDERTKNIPILFVIQLIIIMEDIGII